MDTACARALRCRDERALRGTWCGRYRRLQSSGACCARAAHLPGGGQHRPPADRGPRAVPRPARHRHGRQQPRRHRQAGPRGRRDARATSRSSCDPAKEGLGAAYRHGFRHALDRAYDPIAQMDADFSHDPAVLPLLLRRGRGRSATSPSGPATCPAARCRTGRCPGGCCRGGATGTRSSCCDSGLQDATTAFRVYRADTLERIDIDGTRANGYLFQIETAFRLVGLRRADRRAADHLPRPRSHGASKMAVVRTMVETELRVTWWGISLAAAVAERPFPHAPVPDDTWRPASRPIGPPPGRLRPDRVPTRSDGPDDVASGAAHRRRTLATSRPSAVAGRAPSRSGYVAPLDGLRALAVLAVVLLPLPLPVDPRRVPRGVGVLHALRLPHHLAAAPRVERANSDGRPATVLDPALPTAAAGVVDHDGRSSCASARSGCGTPISCERCGATCRTRCSRSSTGTSSPPTAPTAPSSPRRRRSSTSGAWRSSSSSTCSCRSLVVGVLTLGRAGLACAAEPADRRLRRADGRLGRRERRARPDLDRPRLLRHRHPHGRDADRLAAGDASRCGVCACRPGGPATRRRASASWRLVVTVWLWHEATLRSQWLYPWGLLLTALCTASIIFAAVQGGAAVARC